MSEPFVGEIRMFAGTFAPAGWALCDGQLLAISQNSALFSLLGTIYGGDGQTTFGLPDCRGRVPVHAGGNPGPGLTNRPLGQRSGVETVSLNVAQIPSHTHGGLVATTGSASSATASGNALASSVGGSSYHTGAGRGSTPVPMNPNVLSSSGGSQAHTNLAPTQCVNFIIALFGIYPSQF